jgi:Flp pilus assembly protein TadG
VVAPVLILLLLGMIECGRMIMVQQSLTTAAREGARTAIVEGNSTATAKAVVESFLAGVGVTGSQVTVTPNSTASVLHGQPITVSVSVPFKEVSWLPNPLFLGNKTLSSTASMRRETPN